MTSQVNLADTASLLTEVTNVFALSPEYAGEDLKLADKLLKTNEQVTQAFDEKPIPCCSAERPSLQKLL